LKYLNKIKIKAYYRASYYSRMMTNTSIYIPRMSITWTETAIREVMTCYQIGTVSYVDFTPINQKPGFSENVDQVFKSAFVHFSSPALSSDGKYHFVSYPLKVNTPLPLAFWSTIQNEEPYKLQVSPKEYWICLKNKKPVQRTLMNIHQVVENGRYLENLVTAQAEDIKKLKDTVDGLHKIIYQILNCVDYDNENDDFEFYGTPGLTERINSALSEPR
jgi:hypothetical protein